MAEFAIPFNGDLRLMEAAARTGQVAEIYFAGSKGHDCSDWYRVEGPSPGAVEKGKIVQLLELCKDWRLKANLLCNHGTLFFVGLDRLFRYIHALKHVDAVTVADPFALTRFKSEFPGLDIQVSINMNLDTFCKIERVLKLGAGTVNVAGSMNRQIGALKKLAALKTRYRDFRIKLLANYVCHYDCPFWNQHIMSGLYESQLDGACQGAFGNELCIDRCGIPGGDLSDLIRRPFIRPEDLAYYEKNGCVDIFKLAFRTDDSETLKRKFQAYFSRTHRGNLLDIVPSGGDGPHLSCDNGRFPSDFVRVVCACDKECVRCGYCGKVASKVFGRGARNRRGPDQRRAM